MLMDTQNRISAVQRADSARTVEYLRCMAEDAALSDRVLDVIENSSTYNEAVDEAEAMEIMSQFTADGDEGKNEEIDRITASKSDMSFDEMIGISENISPDECAQMVEAVIMEGANLDLMWVNRKLKKEAKAKLKEAKKYIKSGDKAKAKVALKEASKCVNEAKKSYDSIMKKKGDSIFTMLKGNILHSVVLTIIEIALILPTLLSAGILLPVTWVGQMTVGINEWVVFLKKLANDIKSDKVNANTLNMTAAQVVVQLDKLNKQIEKIEAQL